ncbi:NAD-dependent epimerase/dehydratase family protein [Halobellus marinus]|uniref:NAD-dependent epimerase/dehydratase family protein n=1 Tax=Halobellus TaxID=1073986 RepID=UPI0028A591FB|nr:NAD-dependent epimerase/dehydratase family protein [Halobellus sp. DFY28]
MEYFVTGATGFIGTHLVDRLEANGHEVIALTRDRTNADHLSESVTVVEGDITEKESMRSAMEGVDGVFHLAAWFQVGPGPWNAEKAERINVDGTRNVLELMDDLDVPKGVYVSTVGVYGNTGGEHVDEWYRAPNSFPSVYQRTKWRAHYEVAEPMIADGLPLVIATLGAIYGPGDKDYGGTPRTAFLGHLQQDLPMVPSDFALPWDYVEDTAANLLRAMERGSPGEEYIIANEPRGVAEVLEIVEEMTDIPAPRAVSGTIFYWLSRGIKPVEAVTRPPEGFESELLEFFSSGRVLVDNSKAVRELGIEHRPIEEGLREYLQWELEQLEIETELQSPVA